ncbi:MAG: YhcN/YlaJ family sporulation lipoprotein [Syntrophomonas sp.]
MMKRKTLLLLSLCLSLFLFINGCSNSAAKKPYTPTPQKKTTQTGEMTASERRIMASKLSNLAETVDGVKKATVVVADVGMSNNRGATPTPGTTTNNNGISTNPNPGTMDDTPLPNQTTTKSGQTKNITTNNDVWLNNQASGVIVMVGLTVDPAIMKDEMRKANSQTMVRNKLKASDRRISQVLVSTDPNLIKRINDVAAGILQGKPIKTFEKDIRDLNTRFKQEKPTTL